MKLTRCHDSTLYYNHFTWSYVARLRQVYDDDDNGCNQSSVELCPCTQKLQQSGNKITYVSVVYGVASFVKKPVY